MKSPPSPPLQNRAGEFPCTRLLMWTPLVMGTGLRPPAFVLQLLELYAPRSLSTRSRHYTPTNRSIYIHTATCGHIPTMTIGLGLLVASFTLKSIRLHFHYSTGTSRHLRANEGFKRSIYAGIPSLDSSSEPGYFKGLCTTFVVFR